MAEQTLSAREQARRRRVEENRKHAQALGVEQNPCLQFHQASLQCLAEHNYSRAACTPSFAAYQECMAAENAARKAGEKKTFF